jgi:hypothetical protein
MGRGDYKIVTNPERSPAVDFLTRSGQGPFIDTGVDVLLRSQPGNPVITERVYLSVSTIRQLAQLAGISGAVQHDPVRDAALIAHGKIEAVKEHLDGDSAYVFGALVALLHDAELLAELAGTEVG